MLNRSRVTLLLGSLVTSAVMLHASTPQVATATATASLAAAPDQQLTADGVTLRYRDVGSGDSIVFIHGYSATLESMIGVANALPADYRKVALDIRGFGRSTKFSEPARFGQGMVDDVIHVMDQLKIQRAHLVGHSLGALIAANVVAKYPTRVSTAAFVAGPFWGEAQMAAESQRWISDLEGGNGLLNFMQWLFPGMDPKAAAATNAGVMKANDLGSLTASMRSLPQLAITGLPKDGGRVLLVAGTADPLFPLSTAFAKQTPGATIIEVAGANHVSVITSPEAVKAIAAQLQP